MIMAEYIMFQINGNWKKSVVIILTFSFLICFFIIRKKWELRETVGNEEKWKTDTWEIPTENRWSFTSEHAELQCTSVCK